MIESNDNLDQRLQHIGTQISYNGHLLITLNDENKSFVLAPQKRKTFPLEKFQVVMEEFDLTEIYPPLHVYEVKREKVLVLLILEELLKLEIKLCHHGNNEVFPFFNIRSKRGRKQIHASKKAKYRYHREKKKEETKALKQEYEQIKQENMEMRTKIDLKKKQEI